MSNYTRYSKYFIFCAFLIIILFIQSPSKKEVVVLVPLDHKAMTEITEGIKESLHATKAKVVIKNAHGDQNMLLALIEQIKDKAELIMPIGTTACQSTVAHAKNKKILCIATSIKLDNPLVTSVNDEVPVTISLSKLSNIKNIGIIHSASEKVTPEIEELKKYADENNLQLHLRMVQTLIDLPSAVNSIPKEAEAFLILKDHLIVNGINILVKEANARKIPIIASDEGSVMSGAAVAIGVKEKSIGIKGGEIAKRILEGEVPNQIPPQKIDSLVVFVNKEAMGRQQILTNEIISKVPLPIVEIFSEK